jgi:transposase-like protein
MGKDTAEGLKEAIRVDTAELRGHVDEVVRSSVEETLNALLQAEADQICKAGRYERSPERVDTRAGHYERKLETKAGAVVLKMPKLRSLPFETAIIERYRRREASVEEGLVEMYLAGVSVRRVEDITEALWGTRVSPQIFPVEHATKFELVIKPAKRPTAGCAAKCRYLPQQRRVTELRPLCIELALSLSQGEADMQLRSIASGFGR